MVAVIYKRLKEEVVFTCAFVLMLVTSLFNKGSLEVIDWKVILSLYSLMLIALVLEKYHLLDFIAVSVLDKAKSQRQIGFLMIFTTAALAMFITNDVALLTVVPITIAISRKAGFDPVKIIILETIAANIGSSLTPFGNPQNLFLCTTFHIGIFEFIKIIFPFVFLGLCFAALLNIKIPANIIEYEKVKVSVHNRKELAYFLALFILVLFSVIGIIDYQLTAAAVIVSILIMERDLILKADYYLLGTFICFFIIIDHIQALPQFRNLIEGLLQSKRSVFFVSGLVSQLISNVPAAVLLSGFTKDYDALLMGVSVGGMGTMIASMANLISYKLYTKSYPSGIYNKVFYKYNLMGFILFAMLFSFLI